MADDKRTDIEPEENKKTENESYSAPVNGIEDKLRAAEEGLSRAGESAKARDAELADRRKEAKKESKAKAAEAEKKRRANEKEAQKIAEARLAEFDYAQSYRKKLERERDKALYEAKLREAEARAAEAKAAREIENERVAKILEQDRLEAKARSERADALLRRIARKDVSEEPLDAEERLKSKIAEALKQAAESDAAALETLETPEQAPVAEAVDQPSDVGNEANEESIAHEADEIAGDDDIADNAYEVSDTEGESAETSDETAEPSDDSDTDAFDVDGVPVELSFGSYDSPADAPADSDEEDDDGDVLTGVNKWFGKAPDDEDVEEEEPVEPKRGKRFELSFDDSGNLVEDDDLDEEDDIDPLDEIPKSGMSAEAAALDAELKAFRERFKEKYDKATADKSKNIEYSAEELFLTEDIVELIKESGDSLTKNDVDIRKYHDLSLGAIKNFEKALKQGKKALSANKDEEEAPRIVVSLLKILSKIIEIQSHNLETYARLKPYNYINNARIALRRTINDYNEYAVIYASLTGEQLTRLSTFLPDNIANGKATALVPKLSYDESYVQVLQGKNGELRDADGAMLTQIAPAYRAQALFGICDPPRTRFQCGGYRRLAKRSIKALNKLSDDLLTSLTKTSTAEKSYRRELKSLKDRSALTERGREAYKHKEFELRLKYGKMLTSLRTVKVKSAFEKTRNRLFVGLLAIEREKLSIAVKLLYETYRKGRHSQKIKAQDIFVDTLSSYNTCAERCSKILGCKFEKLPTTLLEKVCRAKKEVEIPVIAYKQTLLETLGDSSRTVSLALSESVAPNEKVYLENSQRILGNKRGIRDRVSLMDDAPMVDRASSMAKVMLDTLRESAESVGSGEEFELYVERSEKVIKFFKRSLKATERAISKAFDENGVVTALVENLRVITNIIEVRRLNISLASKLGRKDYARSEGRALYKNIELYNGRAIDYMSIVGEQFTRITSLPINVISESADKLRIPTITYKDNYIEVFPKDPLTDPIFEKPVQLRGGYYTPLLMQHFRLTENRAVQTTVVNSPFVFDATADDKPVPSWWHPVGFWQYITVIFQPIQAFFKRITTNVSVWFVDEMLLIEKSGLKGRQNRTKQIRVKLEKKLARLNDKHDAQLIALETVVHESDRYTESYQKKLYKINVKFQRKVYKIKLRWMRHCPAQSDTRLLLERLVLERERLMGINKILIKYRNYGKVTFFKNVLHRFKKNLQKAIHEHNETAKLLSERLGVSFSEISPTVADEIIRYGNQIKFPQVVCCREIIETVGGVKRSVGDKWHGYGLYTGASGTDPASKPPLMSVGAMGYATNMGIPYFRADFDNMSIIGMTSGGVPLIGFGGKGAAIPFTGTPMMLAGTDSSPVLTAGLEGSNAPLIGGVNVTDPYSGINSAAVDAAYVRREESKAKHGVNVETPVDIETAMIEERFINALNARSMTMVDGVKTWWKLIGSEINLTIQRSLFLRPFGFLRFLLPEEDEFLEDINRKVSPAEESLLVRISKLGAIIDIECSRLYSATKAGIRRSQRKFSKWLYEDIEQYNKFVDDYNLRVDNPHHKQAERLESEKLEHLSLSMPDRIAQRLDERPESPPKFRLRNKVRTAPYGWKGTEGESDARSAVLDPINASNIEERIENYVLEGLNDERSPFTRLRAPLVKLHISILKWPERERARVNELKARGFVDVKMNRLAEFFEEIFRESLMKLYSREVKYRTLRTYAQRDKNERRHYFVRYEKGNAMKRYNRRIIRAIGMSDDPIKYQRRLHRVLRNYVSCNFRIDYNMRIYQLVQRCMRVNSLLYFGALAVLFIAFLAVALTSQPYSILIPIAYAFVAWAAMPIILWCIGAIYSFILHGVLWVFGVVVSRPTKRYGAKDVESNRFGLVLNCFVCEQHKVLAAALLLKNNENSRRYKKNLIAVVNDYNNSRKYYSDTLRVHIDEIDVTRLIEKIVTGGESPLTEIQNFYYVRELIQINDKYKVGKELTQRESSALIESLNGLISLIARARDQVWRSDMQGARDNGRVDDGMGGGRYISDDLAKLLRSRAVDDFADSVSLLISALQSDNPSMLDEEERFDLKNRLVSMVYQLGELGLVDPAIAREYSRDFIKLIDHIGGLQERVIISALALDNMIF